MTDNTQTSNTGDNNAAETPVEAIEEITTPRRVFKTGSVRIVEDETTQGLSNEEIRALLKTSYPEVANATVREREEADVTIIEFLPKPGRKG